jgi:uncharacterized delta-60 repeat protein
VGADEAVAGRVERQTNGTVGVVGVRIVGRELRGPNGDAFTSAQNGNYTVAVNAGAVKDTAGKGVATSQGTFAVNVPEPNPVDPAFTPVVTNFTAEQVVATAGDKLLVVGRTDGGAVLERRNADGTLDRTFAKTGQVFVPATLADAFYAVVAQGDNVVAAGTSGGDFVLVRYLSTGRLDTSFGNRGRVTVDLGHDDDTAYGLGVGPGGTLVAAGRSNGDAAVARFSANGVVDTSFNQTGTRTLDLGGTDMAGAVAVQSDGKVVLGASSGASVIVLRLNADGTDDPTFSGDGRLAVAQLAADNSDANNPDRAIGLALDAAGNILVGNHTAGGDFGVVRLTPAGNVDSSFGGDGLASSDFGGTDDVDQIIVQPTGEILAFGTTNGTGQTGRAAAAAFDATGAPITSFGTNGQLLVNPGATSSLRELHVGDLVVRAFGARQADGRVILGTSTRTAETTQSTLLRVNAPGSTPSPSGIQIGTFGTSNGVTQKLRYTDGDGTVMMFSIKGGTGAAYLGAGNRINVALTGAGAGSALSIKTTGGGDGRVALGDVTVNGSLRSMNAKTGDLSGTLYASGGVGKLVLGNVTGASIAAAGNIASLTAATFSDSRILAGANLGSDNEFGGTGAAGDTFTTASYGKQKETGQITQ